MNNINISLDTLKWHVNNGVKTPLRRGHPPTLTPTVEIALATAMESYTLLTLAEMLEKPAWKACWRKIGVSSFTRNFLGNQNVVHQLLMLPYSSIDLDTDPNPTAATLPNTRARQDQIQEAKNTPGAKYTAAAYGKKKEAAQPLINKCDGNFMDLPVSELRKVFEWKLQEKSTRLNKDDMVGALMETKEDPPVGEVKWTVENQAEMKRLIEEDIKFIDTELGKAMAKGIKEMFSMTKSTLLHREWKLLKHILPQRRHWNISGQ
eukprot:jgi/Psemu1/29034/gm1.29034_g